MHSPSQPSISKWLLNVQEVSSETKTTEPLLNLLNLSEHSLFYVPVHLQLRQEWSSQPLRGSPVTPWRI